MQLPPELKFLSGSLADPKQSYRRSSWLKSDFDDPIWVYNFNQKQSLNIDWQVPLDDGTMLTAPKNKTLLDSFKYYLIAATRDSCSNNETNSLKSQSILFRHACQIIDFIILRSERFELSRYGLGGLTSGNLIEILEGIASDRSAAESIYNWTSELRSFCIFLHTTTDREDITRTISKLPHIATISEAQINNDKLGIPYNLIPQIRASLYINGFYARTSRGHSPNSVKISNEIYSRSIFGKLTAKPQHEILSYCDYESYDRECKSVNVTTGLRDRIRESKFFTYKRLLYSLGTLIEMGLPAPSVESILEADKYYPDMATNGRFRTLPSKMVFMALRQAIEFHIENGQEITRGFCKLALECKKRNCSPHELRHEINNIIGENLTNLGVSDLSIGFLSERKQDKATYYTKLRANNGLYELISVYIGAVQLVVGVLMARRQSELTDLTASACLSESQDWLFFDCAKSTRSLNGLRQKLARPIEPIAADMIKTLIRMQKTLARIGYINSTQGLFSMPDFRGSNSFTKSTSFSFNRNLDLFCDYFQTPKNHLGERYYFRQHQLRRFFAMVFFYCGSFSKLDTLQWMLGHCDPEHVWHYITESVEGAVLTGAKAQFIAECLHNSDYNDNFNNLTDLLSQRYGTTDFSLIASSDLEDSISDLINEGFIEIEPEFFYDNNGRQFKVVARLLKQKADLE